MHPANGIRCTTSSKLKNKKILLAVTGSIAAVNTIHLARELIRHGANVIPVMSLNACHIIHPYSLEFATSHKPITSLTGQTEHVTHCGLVKKPVDLILICPCTANTLSKIAHGIDDTPVTTFTTTAIGSGIPIIIVPAMHLSMYKHQSIQKNIDRCNQLGIEIIKPIIKEHKAKMPSNPEIVAKIIRTLAKSDLATKRILIIGGTTAEPIDDVRILTTKSSGETAISLSINAYERGADISLWYGKSPLPIPPYIKSTRFNTFNDLLTLVKNTKLDTYDHIIICAAISDYQPQLHKGKISSGQKNLYLKLKPTKKIIAVIKEKYPNISLSAFKLESTKKPLQIKASHLQKKYHLHMVIGNTIQSLDSLDSEIFLFDKKGDIYQHKGKKDAIAEIILTHLLE